MTSHVYFHKRTNNNNSSCSDVDEIIIEQIDKLQQLLEMKFNAITVEADNFKFDNTVTHIHVFAPFDLKNIATIATLVAHEENDNQILIMFDRMNYFIDFLLALRGFKSIKNLVCATAFGEIVKIVEGAMI